MNDDLEKRLLRVGERIPVPCPDGIKGCLVAHYSIETNPVCREAAAEIRSLRAEIERRKYDSVHTCHDQCQRAACVLRRENEALRAQVEQERAGIVAFLRREAARETPFGLDPMSALGLPLDYAAAMIERHEDKEPRA